MKYDDAHKNQIQTDQKSFEDMYARGEKPWDSGVPSAELIKVLDAGKLPGKTILEFGCGTGTNAVELARRGYKVTAVDFVAAIVDVAKKKAQDAKVSIDFRAGDATTAELGGPYDALFDRGVYHSIREWGLAPFLKQLEKVSHKGTRWLSLAGNANEKTEYGPPRVHEKDIRAELGGLFEILDLHEFRFGTDSEQFRPLAWSILMERR